MNIIVFIIVGLMAGWIAGSVVKGHGLGALGDIVVGIIGAFVGGFIFEIFGITAYGFIGSLLMSVAGAIVFLVIVGMFTGPYRDRIGFG